MTIDRTDILTTAALADRICKALQWLPDNATKRRAESALAEMQVRLWIADKGDP